MTDDTELLRRYVEEQSQAAFTELVERYIDLVFSAALPRVGHNTQLAEDVTQRVFSDLARKAASLAALPALAGWLYTSARFAASNVVRSERRLRERERIAHEMNTILVTDPTVDWEQLRPVLEAAIDQLEVGNREAVVLRFFGRRSFAEIGGALRLSEDAAQKRVDRSLDLLREVLAKRGITSPTAAIGTLLAANVGVAAPAGLAAQVTTVALSGLAAAGGAGLSVAGSLQLMTAAKITSAITATVALLAIGYGVYQFQAVRAADAEHASLAAEQTNLQAKLAELTKAQREADDANRALAQQLEQARQAAASRPIAAGPAIQNVDLKAIARQNLPLAVTSSRAALRVRFGPFYRARNLTTAQIESLELLLAEGDSINVFTKGAAPAESALYQQARARLTQMQADMNQLLGENGAKAFQDYQWTADLRDVANSVVVATYFTDTPVTADQSEKLTQLLIASSSWPERRGRVDPASIKWDVVMPQAKEFLSSAQFAALEAAQSKSVFDDQYRKLTGMPVAPARLPGL